MQNNQPIVLPKHPRLGDDESIPTAIWKWGGFRGDVDVNLPAKF